MAELILQFRKGKYIYAEIDFKKLICPKINCWFFYLSKIFLTMRWSQHYHQGYGHELIEGEKIYAIWHTAIRLPIL